MRKIVSLAALVALLILGLSALIEGGHIIILLSGVTLLTAGTVWFLEDFGFRRQRLATKEELPAPPQ